jgi:hypothetical protein
MMGAALLETPCAAAATAAAAAAAALCYAAAFGHASQPIQRYLQVGAGDEPQVCWDLVPRLDQHNVTRHKLLCRNGHPLALTYDLEHHAQQHSITLQYHQCESTVTLDASTCNDTAALQAELHNLQQLLAPQPRSAAGFNKLA